nr:hypothetical protein VIGAN_08326900 [Ipomoea batatas]
MNFCSLSASPIAISLICSSDREVEDPNETKITEFCSCLSSQARDLWRIPESLFSGRITGLNGPIAHCWLALSIGSLASKSRNGPSIILQELKRAPELNFKASF